jgi:hypothetical protein
VAGLTRENGTFTLQVPSGPVVLTVRRIGYPQTDVAIPTVTSSVDIVLKRDPLKLDQVVITGQATGISRRNLATSVASVSAEEMTKVTTQSIENAFQGKVAGAQISQSTGAPGGGNRIRIRGISSILGSAQPLYVVDGVIVSDVAIGSGTNKVTKAAGSAISVGNQENPDKPDRRPESERHREHRDPQGLGRVGDLWVQGIGWGDHHHQQAGRDRRAEILGAAEYRDVAIGLSQ